MKYNRVIKRIIKKAYRYEWELGRESAEKTREENETLEKTISEKENREREKKGSKSQGCAALWCVWDL